MGTAKRQTREVEEDLVQGLLMVFGYWDNVGPYRNCSWQDLRGFAEEMLKKYDPMTFAQIMKGPRK